MELIFQMGLNVVRQTNFENLYKISKEIFELNSHQREMNENENYFLLKLVKVFDIILMTY